MVDVGGAIAPHVYKMAQENGLADIKVLGFSGQNFLFAEISQAILVIRLTLRIKNAGGLLNNPAGNSFLLSKLGDGREVPKMGVGPWELLMVLIYVGIFAIVLRAALTVFKIAKKQESIERTLKEISEMMKSKN